MSTLAYPDHAVGAEELYDSDQQDSPSYDEDEKAYTILSMSGIRRRQQVFIDQISTTLDISRSSSCILLRHYKWEVQKALDDWFSDEDAVRHAVGLLEESTTSPAGISACGICFDEFPIIGAASAAACGHRYCSDCWRGYLDTAISDGPQCLALRCPHPSCGAAVGPDMISALATDPNRYYSYLFRSYVEDSNKKRKYKWCPAPDCEFAVVDCLGHENKLIDVHCDCSHIFCFSCSEEAHRPVSCETVAKWVAKNSSDSENTAWLVANSKACPMCKRRIEKNAGCVHMTCSAPCGYEFCWMCLGAWKEHPGSFYKCKKYEEAKKEGVYEEEERERKEAIKSLGKYTYYYERWTSNHKSRQQAMEMVRGLEEDGRMNVLRKAGQTERDLKFITDAWNQIAECRRVLKWTCAYAYYLERPKRHLFKQLEGEADAVLERLHHCAEEDLARHMTEETEVEEPKESFKELGIRLKALTCGARTFFQNLVGALETGLQEVSIDHEGDDGDDEMEYIWFCKDCTFANPIHVTICQVCNRDREVREDEDDGEDD